MLRNTSHWQFNIFASGSFQMTWQDIMVGVQSGLLMFPINILIITIFRSIRPGIVSESKKDDPDDIFKPPVVTIPTILKVSFVLLRSDFTLLPNSFECIKELIESV